ncbi:MAG: DNA recombination protein RmuC [Verrucomicrobia bacterium]|nr:DNA recombination protein RmuC [Verrucomicrobiota bacterium]
MTEIFLGFALVLLVGNLVLTVVLLSRRLSVDLSGLQPRFDALQSNQERTERAFREELGRNREEGSSAGKQLREELSGKISSFGDSLQSRLAEIAGLQQKQLDSFAQQLAALTQTNALRLEALRTAVDTKLKEIQEDNARQLDRMRTTVDEKLQSTLEKRLGESFKQVSERLEQVHQGLGDMQKLAAGVGDLKRVLTNVKSRGVWGEVQLGALLEEVFTPEQYDRNVKTKESSSELVEFAIRFPGQGDSEREVLWLPIDSKFPIEDYQRLLDAQEKADPDAAEEAARMLAAQVKASAKDISDKYLNPPNTTNFGILFLPTEGLFAEVTRRAGLTDAIRREHNVIVAGPTTLLAMLNSFQMGFRTLAIRQRSDEVWKLLSGVKTEFGKFGDLLEGVKRKLEQASNTMDDVAQRSRAIERKLRNVQELPASEVQPLLANGGAPVSGDSE